MGLADCYISAKVPGEKHSTQSWPHLLAQLINIDNVENQGVCGASNLEILYNILNYEFKPQDLVVTLWTWPDRDLIFGRKSTTDSEQELTRLGLWMDDKIVSQWLSIHPETDILTRSWLYIQHAELYLKIKNIKQYHLNMEYIKMNKYKPNFVTTPVLDINCFQLQDRSKKALDNAHPGAEFHLLLADTIAKNTNEH